jgi:TolB-like protein
MATSLAVIGSPGQALAPPAGGAECLDSWKQIAAFFGRTCRTVQRWERAESLPVYRHIHEKVGSVYAFERELITWRDTRSRKDRANNPQDAERSQRLRMAVLPFVNLSTDPRVRQFEDGLTAEIICQLACLDAARLGMIARTTVMAHKKSRLGIAEIGRILCVDYVLEGTIRTVGRDLRIAAQLINVADQMHVLGNTFLHRWTGAVSVQIACAERIAGMVSTYLLTASTPPAFKH